MSRIMLVLCDREHDLAVFGMELMRVACQNGFSPDKAYIDEYYPEDLSSFDTLCLVVTDDEDIAEPVQKWLNKIYEAKFTSEAFWNKLEKVVHAAFEESLQVLYFGNSGKDDKGRTPLIASPNLDDFDFNSEWSYPFADIFIFECNSAKELDQSLLISRLLAR